MKLCVEQSGDIASEKDQLNYKYFAIYRYMKNIPGLTPTEPNIGSVRDILFVPTTEVDFIKPMVDGLLEFDALQFESSPAAVYKLEFTTDTGRYKYEKAKGDQGVYFKLKITGSIPKDYAFRKESFDDMDNRKFFVITRDNNNKPRLHGYIDLDGEKYGMTFSEDFDTGGKRSDFSGFDFQFYMESRYRPRPMEEISSIPIDPGFPSDPDTGAGGIGVPIDGGEA